MQFSRPIESINATPLNGGMDSEIPHPTTASARPAIIDYLDGELSYTYELIRNAKEHLDTILETLPEIDDWPVAQSLTGPGLGMLIHFHGLRPLTKELAGLLQSVSEYSGWLSEAVELIAQSRALCE